MVGPICPQYRCTLLDGGNKKPIIKAYHYDTGEHKRQQLFRTKMTDNRLCKLNLLKRRARCNVLRRRQNSNFISECHIFTSLIALSHIHVSAGYRSHIYENFDTLRPEPNFVRATYVPCMYDVPATFTWRNSDISLFVWKFTVVCTAYQCVCATYV